MKNKIITALLSFAIAWGLWAYVITVERTEIEDVFYNVPVVLDGETILEERGLMLTSQRNQTVTLKLKGNRSDLANLRSSDIVVLVDLTKIHEAGDKKLTYDVSFPADIQGSAIEVVSREPSTIPLTVEQWATKEVPVRLNYTGNVPEGYNADKQNAVIEYNTVTVTGPADIISQIAMAKVTVNLENQTQTLVENLRYALCDESGEPISDVSSVTTNRGEIKVTVPVQMVKDVKLTYTVVEGGGLTAGDVTITADYETITVAGNAASLIALEEIDLGTVDLGTLTESGKLVFPIKLPEGVTNQTGITSVTVDVVLPELETRSYDVTNFRIENVPKGMRGEIVNKILNVEVRGRGPILDKLKPEDIVVVVDFTDVTLGRFTMEATIEIKKYETVGAVNTYYVNVSVVEA